MDKARWVITGKLPSNSAANQLIYICSSPKQIVQKVTVSFVIQFDSQLSGHITSYLIAQRFTLCFSAMMMIKSKNSNSEKDIYLVEYSSAMISLWKQRENIESR